MSDPLCFVLMPFGYWDFATQIELNNLGLLWRARADAGRKLPWEQDVENDLRQDMEQLRGARTGGGT